MRPPLVSAVPAQRSRAPTGPAYRVFHGPQARFGRETGFLVLAAFAVCAIVVLGVLLLGTPVTPRETSRAQPDPGTSSATIELDQNGDVGSASIELTTDQSSLHLSVPRRTGLVARFDPQVTAIRIIAGDAMIEVDPIGPGESRAVELPEGTSAVRVEFTATDTYGASSADAPERGLTLLTPLAIAETAGDDWTVEVSDDRVVNVACVAGQEMTNCANAPSGVWVAEPGAGMDVVAQVDLG